MQLHVFQHSSTKNCQVSFLRGWFSLPWQGCWPSLRRRALSERILPMTLVSATVYRAAFAWNQLTCVYWLDLTQHHFSGGGQAGFG